MINKRREAGKAMNERDTEQRNTKAVFTPDT